MTSHQSASSWVAVASVILVAVQPCGAQAPEDASPPADKEAVAKPTVELAPLTAPAAVREGNRRLLAGKPAEALQAYQHAETLAPDAREVAFVEGLAHYDLKEFDEARRAFERAAGSHSDALADDALYSLATCDHAEALNKEGNPQEALGLLESAMERYRNVLDHRPDHAAARDANYKAAAMWRQLKQLMEQQQQQQQSDDQNEQEQEQNEQQQQEQQQKDNQEQQSEEQSQEQQQQQEQKGQQEQEQQSAQQQQQQQQEQEEQAAQAEPDEQEQVSREQAERKLREMMQALRDRQKARRQQAERMPVRPVEKDW